MSLSEKKITIENRIEGKGKGDIIFPKMIWQFKDKKVKGET